jgi:hypothetical protein
MKTDFSLFQFQNTRGIVYIYSGTSWKLVWYGINNFEEKKINTNKLSLISKPKNSYKKSNKSKIYWGKNTCVSVKPTIFGQTLIKISSFTVDFFILGV